MSPLEANVAGALRAQESFDGGNLLGINDAFYPTSGSTEGRGTIYEEGGRVWIIQLTRFLRKELLPAIVTADMDSITADDADTTADNVSAPPRDGLNVTYQNRAYRIHYVTDLGGAYRLRLADRYSDQ